MASTRYWIVVASKDHVEAGREEGFAQACHGKRAPLKRMMKGDGVIYYSPKNKFKGTEKCQAFTAIGKVKDEEVHQAKMGNDFEPFRRNVEFCDAQETSILPLLLCLSFISNKTSWGAIFRTGFFQVPKEDFLLVAEKMQVQAVQDFA
jgi:hypothetical protein